MTRIWPATIDDVEIIFDFINKLAIYEKEPNAVKINVAQLKEDLFPQTSGKNPRANVIFASLDANPTKPVAFALYFYIYSTWEGTSIHLEDLFVLDDYRKSGVGSYLLTYIAEIAIKENCKRVEWTALDWNTPALTFYEKKVCAKRSSEWYLYRLTGQELQNVAKGSLFSSKES